MAIRKNYPVQAVTDEAVASAVFGQDDPVLRHAERVRRAKGMTPGQRKKVEADRARKKASYDLPEWLIEAVRGLAEAQGVPVSSVAAALMIEALRAGVDLERWPRRPSHSPFYDSVLVLPESEEK